MKILFCLIFLFGFCFCIDYSPSENYEGELYVNDGVYQDYSKYDDKKDGVGDGDPIIRPCNPQDIDCIRKVFATNSRCTPTKRPIPDPYEMKHLLLDAPQANLTYVMDIFQFKGLNEWKIQEFYINKATDKLVLEVVFDRIVVITPNATIRYHRKGKEPAEISDYSTIEYNDVSLTLTIPRIKDSIQPSRGHVYAYLPDAVPMYTLGSRFLRSKEPDMAAAFADFTLNAALSIREVYVQQGPVVMSIFLQNTICDFGYDPSALAARSLDCGSSLSYPSVNTGLMALRINGSLEVDIHHPTLDNLTAYTVMYVVMLKNLSIYDIRG